MDADLARRGGGGRRWSGVFLRRGKESEKESGVKGEARKSGTEGEG
jgi:hypothetical protein